MAKAPPKPPTWTPQSHHASYVSPELSQSEVESLNQIRDAALDVADRISGCLRYPCPSNNGGMLNYVRDLEKAVAIYRDMHAEAEAWRNHERFRTVKGTCPSFAHLTAAAADAREGRNLEPDDPDPHEKYFIVNSVHYCTTCRKRKVMEVPRRGKLASRVPRHRFPSPIGPSKRRRGCTHDSYGGKDWRKCPRCGGRLKARRGKRRSRR